MPGLPLSTTALPEEKGAQRQGPYNWAFVRQIAFQHKKALLIANLVAIVATIAAVPVPLLMPLLVDEVLLNQPGVVTATFNYWFPASWHGPWLYVFGIFLFTVVLRVISLVLSVFQARQFTLIAKDIVFSIRKGLLQRLQTISMAEYESVGSGAVASHFVTDLDTVDQFIGESVSKLLIAVLTILGTAVVLLWMHWQLALFILLMNPLVIYVTTVIGRQVKQLKKHENSAYEVFQAALTEALDSIQQIRAANREQHYLSQLISGAAKVRDFSGAFHWRSDAANRFSFMVFLVGFDLFRAISMMMVLLSDLSVGQMIAVFGYLWFMMGPVQELLAMQYSYYAADGALSRINRLMRLQQEPQYPHEVNPFTDKQTVSVELKDVHFAYKPEQPVLQGISLRIPAGNKIALVGASGGGKSTLVQVLLGLYPAGEGQILFDGIPVTKIGMDVVRDNVATVLQHPALFNDSIRANLNMGRKTPEQALWQALETAQLADFVRELPEQLETQVGRQGVRLSGGQRQRLAIARMVLSDPKVVVLDEATSALDTATEQALHQALAGFLQGRTTIIIAHRLSAVKQADHVYVFEDGHIIEQGSHEHLLQEQGLYARLYGDLQT